MRRIELGWSVSVLCTTSALALASCGPKASDASGEPAAPTPAPVATGNAQWAPAGSDPAAPAGPNPAGDAPEISRSVGVDGGVVVLWPRIVLPRGSGAPDAETRALAGQVQRHLAAVAARALPGSAGDIRPEPERVCPRSGCKAVAVSVLLARAGQGCSVVALVSAPGPSPSRLVPWSGVVRLDAPTTPFREPPERAVKVTDYARCSAIIESLAEHAPEVERAIQQAAGR